MLIVKSSATHLEFITGRKVVSCVHREDITTAECVGMIEVADKRDTDIIIPEGVYDSLVVELKQYNVDNLFIPVKMDRTTPLDVAKVELARAVTEKDKLAVLIKLLGVDA